MTNYVLVLICCLFSFACALLKQLYDAHYYPKNIYVFVIDVALSGISGIVLGFILSEQIQNELAIIGLSGLGGMFGVGALKALMKSNLDKLVHIPINFDEHNKGHNANANIKDTKDDYYNCTKEQEHAKPHSQIKIVRNSKES